MSILNDKEITELALAGAITPFIPTGIRAVERVDQFELVKVISYGLTSFGYDVRLAEDDVRIFRNKPSWAQKHDAAGNTVSYELDEIDPKRFDPNLVYMPDILRDEEGSPYVSLPGYSYLLGYTPEVFDLPRDIIVHCLGKSTYARAAVSVNITPIEPGFKGQVVIEVTNHCGLPVRIYLNEGIAQFAFFRGNPCEVSYADRNGKYLNQMGVTLSKA